MTDTIYALSSGQSPAAVAIIRISGPAAASTLKALAGRVPKSRRATLQRLTDPASGDVLDHALTLWFDGPATATGEDLAELHLHGGRAVVARVLRTLAALPGLKPAEPGAFTRRAFENGRIDLAEAEGLADLLFAETELQRLSAIAMAEGGLSTQVVMWQDKLLGLSARTEALLDFSDEDDVDEDAGAATALSAEIAAMAAEVRAFLARPSGERLRDGIRVALAGPPNVGKSTLLNALAGREAAIVSPRAGTTRDVIEVPLALAGRPYVFVDTAGLHAGSGDEIEAIGMERARRVIAKSDIILWLDEQSASPAPERTITVHARADVAGREVAPSSADLAVSAATGEGMDRLVGMLTARADALLPRPGELALNTRQRDLLADCVESLVGDADLLITAENLRRARGALDRLTGRAGTEDMLDALFGRFCIGK
ncbi:tRNA uridine-5-carboxymethylaminomethyl(34) synthesis GTPase MnmE [Sphingomonas cavernae]|uniref:tRNA modification GTPase MnmE n=1 Tax=Sphingomonas cavernae TaxID=2320861 RepID=A0A418WR44_9SPHN|nr:tRNA uridine-5-carboxymethylaminomethyl(34) synthesis GTPase MnmE [Sphingomonas cavernae]RJF93718.1 tRNA uridine-5-carboxymethylaminomethyl(34) synthesis GTPase MnmE [Sphingomonas cavernae]